MSETGIPIVLVRHASTAWTGHRYCGRSDPPLDDAGRIAADRLAVELVPVLEPATRIVSSPSVRALATAEAIAAAAGIATVATDPRWLESDCGTAEGRTFDELALTDPELAARLAAGDAGIDWPGGETALDLRTRVLEAWTALVDEARPTVVVSHAGPLRWAMAFATGQAPWGVAWTPPGIAVHLSVRARAGPSDPAGAAVDPSRATLRR